jgi:hypothetical protein
VKDILPALHVGDQVIGVIVGAGLTGLIGFLNRRHQERREDKTRWHNDRLRAYLNLCNAFTDAIIYMMQPSGSRDDK